MQTRGRGVAAVALVLVALATAGLPAQQDQVSLRLNQQIERIFGAASYDPPAFGPARWMPDRDGLHHRRACRAAGHRHGPRSLRRGAGAREVLVPASRLTPPGPHGAARHRRLRLVGRRQAPAGLHEHAQGLAAAHARRLLGGGLDAYPPGRLAQGRGRRPATASLMFAKFSPDGTRVAYVRANDLYVERLAGGPITTLTTTGRETTINGTTDWVYEEELGVRDGFRWSPDGRRDRLLAVRHDRRRHLHAHQHHRHALSDGHAHSVPEARHRPTVPRVSASSPPRVAHDVDGDAWRSTRPLPRAARVARLRHARHPAAQPAAEPAGPAAADASNRRRHAGSSATVVRDLARGRGHGALGRRRPSGSCGRANATAGATSTVCREGRHATRR